MQGAQDVTGQANTAKPTITIQTQSAPKPAVEAVPAPVQEQAPAVDPKLQMYAKKERELRQLHRQIESDKALIAQKEQEYQSKYIPKEQYEQTFQSVETIANEMLRRGLTPQQLNEYFISQPSTMDPAYQKVQALEAKIAELESRQTKQVEEQTEIQRQNLEQAKMQINSEAKRYIESEPDKFKAIKGEKAVNAIGKLVEQTFYNGFPGEFEKGEVMPIDRAAEIVEQHIRTEAKRMQAYFEAEQKQEAPPPQDRHPIIARQPQIKTITNNVKESTKPLSPRDRAILALQGKL